MAKHNETGAKGEELAAAYLIEKGYSILQRNWYHKRTEVDIVAERDGKYYLIEVKTRRGLGYGWPEDAITKTKKKDLMAAANAYIEQYPETYTLQFDIIGIILDDHDEIAELVHWEDAFC